MRSLTDGGTLLPVSESEQLNLGVLAGDSAPELARLGRGRTNPAPVYSSPAAAADVNLEQRH